MPCAIRKAGEMAEDAKPTTDDEPTGATNVISDQMRLSHGRQIKS